jgi:invasion protein IalB
MRMTTFAAAVLAALVAAPAAAQAPAAPAQDDNAWVKICNRDEQAKKDLCLITQELRTNSGQFLASIAIRETPGEQRKVLLASVPVGMVIKPGVQLQIDGGQATKVDYTICFPNACYAELATEAAFITKLKAGGKLQMTTFNQQGKPVRFELTLIGFTSAYDGAGINPADLEKKQADLQRQLDERAKAARDKLVAEQRRAVDEGSPQ